ncbi:MAG: (2Fe-2S)-binding protein [Rhodospirillaceae bacterium]|nr:(2Fe-2S)-binding protein [Rhodospirillaceae bacterium]
MTGEPVMLRVNGTERPVAAVAPWTTLLTVLRDEFGLTGAKRGCNQGVCGACTVTIDGEPVRSCLSLALNCADRDIVTVEGLVPAGAPAGALAPVQQALAEGNAVQCGFCTPGILISAHALLRRNAPLTVDEVRAGLSGNLCRCSGYKKIVEAVVSASEARP